MLFVGGRRQGLSSFLMEVKEEFEVAQVRPELYRIPAPRMNKAGKVGGDSVLLIMRLFIRIALSDQVRMLFP